MGQHRQKLILDTVRALSGSPYSLLLLEQFNSFSRILDDTNESHCLVRCLIVDEVSQRFVSANVAVIGANNAIGRGEGCV